VISQGANGVILYPRGGGNGDVILNGANTFGNTLLSQGNIGVGIDSALPAYSPVGLGTIVHENAGDCALFAVNGARTIGNPFAWANSNAPANRILIFKGTNQLTLSGTIDLSAAGAVVTNRLIRVDNTNAATILSGIISGTGCGINKSGNGALYLDGVNTYNGPTTNSAGLLAGSGTIAGPVVVTNSVLGGGSATTIGTLTVGNNVSFIVNGGAYFRLNTSLSPQSNDVVSVTGTLVNTGTGNKVTVNNLGPALKPGDKFNLFSKAVTGGGSMYVVGAGVTWSNYLALDGSIQVSSTNDMRPVFATITIGYTAGDTTNVTFNVTNAPVGYNYYVLASTNVTMPIANWTRLYTNVFTAGSMQIQVTNGVPKNMPNRFYLLTWF
jgi:autotransporter-associated beta strand protein